jgi:hypothetical protein
MGNGIRHGDVHPYGHSPDARKPIDLRGTDNTTLGNVGKVEAGRTTHMDLTLVFHGTAPG